MHELRLWYNSHRKKIWMTVGIIVVIGAIIQLTNFFISRNNDKTYLNQNASNSDIINEIKNETNVDLESTQSLISGNTNSKEKLKSATSVIGEFMEYCNQGNTEGAYNLLTQDCKEQVYNSLQVFEQAYYEDIFKGEEKIYSVENWIGDIYRVSISENMLATGKSNNGYSKQDYMTVEKINGEYKLNINSYIGFSEIHKTTEDKENNITIEVLYKNTYMDREEYTIRVTNNNEEAITLDGMSNAESLYLENSNGKKYYANMNEITTPMLEFIAGETKDITLKFYNRYTSNLNISKMVFSSVIIYKGQGSEKVEVKADI